MKSENKKSNRLNWEPETDEEQLKRRFIVYTHKCFLLWQCCFFPSRHMHPFAWRTDFSDFGKMIYFSEYYFFCWFFPFCVFVTPNNVCIWRLPKFDVYTKKYPSSVVADWYSRRSIPIHHISISIRMWINFEL